MDNTALESLLSDSNEQQFWLKPIGPPRDDPEWDAPEHRTWSHSPIEIHFARSPAQVAVGAIIIAYSRRALPCRRRWKRRRAALLTAAK